MPGIVEAIVGKHRSTDARHVVCGLHQGNDGVDLQSLNAERAARSPGDAVDCTAARASIGRWIL
jgi:hypothetical protein